MILRDHFHKRLLQAMRGFRRCVRGVLRPFRSAALIAQLRRELRETERLLLQQTAAARFSRRIFERSAAAARMGVWCCSLPDNSLDWTDVIYDIFDLPRGTPLRRTDVTRYYVGASLEKMQQLRNAAIEAGDGFSMEAEIVTAKGNHRWIRITATVERRDGRAVRIFGIKQDITEEKLLRDRTEYLASFDVMTGLANRARFQSRLAEFCAAPKDPERLPALMILDLDGFKQLNDTFGHAEGDACLRETARRLQEACPDAALIARIGGDEFAVLVENAENASALSAIAMRIVRTLYRRVSVDGLAVQMGASVGVAVFDPGTDSIEGLFRKADAALYAAKAAGRNTYMLSGVQAGETAGQRQPYVA